MHYLIFDLSEDTEGVTTLEEPTSTSAEQHAAVMAEVQQVRAEPDAGPGTCTVGMDWGPAQQVSVKDGRRHFIS
ncbi:MAG: hypothetical protein IV092_01035 [Burkholderiaceae bacterium]|nr:hypothetical protein [Burkholderiaceae bacterium]